MTKLIKTTDRWVEEISDGRFLEKQMDKTIYDNRWGVNPGELVEKFVDGVVEKEHDYHKVSLPGFSRQVLINYSQFRDQCNYKAKVISDNRPTGSPFHMKDQIASWIIEMEVDQEQSIMLSHKYGESFFFKDQK